ncbi:hypothetical protein J7K24_02350 [bacterium]|nr:hypothetical protein [bacterium]
MNLGKIDKKIKIGIIFLVLSVVVFIILENQQKNNESVKTTGIVSARIFYSDILLKPVYDASVFVNGNPVKVYGATYLGLDIPQGRAIIEVYT